MTRCHDNSITDGQERERVRENMVVKRGEGKGDVLNQGGWEECSYSYYSQSSDVVLSHSFDANVSLFPAIRPLWNWGKYWVIIWGIREETIDRICWREYDGKSVVGVRSEMPVVGCLALQGTGNKAIDDQKVTTWIFPSKDKHHSPPSLWGEGEVLDQTMSGGIVLCVVSSELGAKLITKSNAERLVKGRRRRSTCFDAPDLFRAKASSPVS